MNNNNEEVIIQRECAFCNHIESGPKSKFTGSWMIFRIPRGENSTETKEIAICNNCVRIIGSVAILAIKPLFEEIDVKLSELKKEE